MRIVVATGNPHKRTELRRILDGLDVELVSMDAFGLARPVEDGATFEANALLKARAAVAGTGLAALADDSGLEVDALGGAPGVHSARYAGVDAGDADAANNRKLLRELASTGPADRSARFVCVAALALPDGRTFTERGVMEGRVTDQPRGAGGFGYDPYFVARGNTRTNAELTPAEKDARSHRGAAFRAIRPRLAAVLADDGAA